jgi:beta-ribofuranosylaminobenzene 5'-phosphate synthase
MPDQARAQRVDVSAPARLHLGFLDLAGGLGRRFGSLGLAIDGCDTRLTLTRAAAPAASGPGAARALDYVALAAAGLKLSPNVRVTIAETSPAHAGFGTGTQLALAVATAMARLDGVGIPAAEIARKLGRGTRSGIGIGIFEQGGFIVDGGRRDDGGIAPIIARLPFPREWRLLLVLDPALRGLHGTAERDAFAKLPPFPEALAGRLCRDVLLRLLPGIVEHDFTAVSQSLGEIQRELGDYFSSAQKGRYASQIVAEALCWVASRERVVGIGQSSWGPTGFALVESETRAEEIEAELKLRATSLDLQFRIVAGANRGADISVT